jgi:hypothetical protein
MVIVEKLVEWRLAGWNRSTQRQTCPSATLSITNPTWLDPGLNPGRRGKKPATNCLSYGAVSLQRYFILRSDGKLWTQQEYQPINLDAVKRVFVWNTCEGSTTRHAHKQTNNQTGCVSYELRNEHVWGGFNLLMQQASIAVQIFTCCRILSNILLWQGKCNLNNERCTVYPR